MEVLAEAAESSQMQPAEAQGEQVVGGEEKGLQEASLRENEITEGQALHPLYEQIDLTQTEFFEDARTRISEADFQVRINAEKGALREQVVGEGLGRQYPEAEGYKVIPEAPLRDAGGEVAIDGQQGSHRRVDFAVAKDGKVVDMREVTSATAPKEAQIAKESRIRESGDISVKDPDTGELLAVPEDVQTRLNRIDLSNYGYHA